MNLHKFINVLFHEISLFDAYIMLDKNFAS